MPEPHDLLDLLDWKRAIFSLYADVRSADDPEAIWRRWRAVRDEMFRGHPQSPLAAEDRAAFGGLSYFDYEPAWRLLATIELTDPHTYDIPASNDGAYSFTRFAIARAEAGAEIALECYWLEGYGGGLFLPFRDATSGKSTYGAGRYLLDTVKGADLGMHEGRLVLDFNFAYNPSCSYDSRWVCPLAPPANWLPIAVEAGERHEPRGANRA
jgi:uncharacterized protein